MIDEQQLRELCRSTAFAFTQFLSFIAADFFTIILVLKTVSDVHNYMVSNFLSLCASKTDFHIIGLPQQLIQLRNPTIRLPYNVALTHFDSAHNLGLGVILYKNPTLSHHISFIS